MSIIGEQSLGGIVGDTSVFNRKGLEIARLKRLAISGVLHE
jgi:hypothetical protein